MTVAAIDRPMHHAVILGMNVENYRRRAALGRTRTTNGTIGETTGAGRSTRSVNYSAILSRRDICTTFSTASAALTIVDAQRSP
jgi:hypothetical protein